MMLMMFSYAADYFLRRYAITPFALMIRVAALRYAAIAAIFALITPCRHFA